MLWSLFQGRVISALTYLFAAVAAYRYGTKANKVALGLLIPLAYMFVMYSWLAYLAYYQLSDKHLIPAFQLGQWALAMSMGSTMFMARRVYKKINKG